MEKQRVDDRFSDPHECAKTILSVAVFVPINSKGGTHIEKHKTCDILINLSVFKNDEYPHYYYDMSCYICTNVKTTCFLICLHGLWNNKSVFK